MGPRCVWMAAWSGVCSEPAAGFTPGKPVLTKAYGSTNAVNLVKATFDGLMKLRTRAQVAKLRGVELA